MRSIIVLLMLLLAPPASLGAQSTDARELAAAVRTAISTASLERNTRAIVQHARPSGSPGENAAIDTIVRTLASAGVPVEVHTFVAYTSDPVSARVEIPGTAFAPAAITMSFSAAVESLEGRLVDVGTLADLPDLESGTGELMTLAPRTRTIPDVAGAIALVEGQPRNVPVAVLAMLGARAVIFSNPEERLNELIVTSTWGNPSLRNRHRLPQLPAVQVTKSAGDSLRARLARGEVSIRVSAQVRTGWQPLRLAVARIEAPADGAPFVLLGGHIDAWHHGGTDEGASNAAMLELALAFHAQRDRLRRGLVVAWWPGHSNARYAGSTWFADHFFEELRARGIAYLNIDGMGQMGAKRFGAQTTSSLAGLATDVVRSATGESIRPGRPGRNSDQSFNGVGLPLLQIDHTRLAEDGGYWWWHTPDDDIDKVDFDVLALDTRLYAEALAVLLAEPVLPVDFVAEIEALGEAIERREAAGAGLFDLTEARRKQQALLEHARRARDAATRSPGAPLDLAIIDALRPLHRVLYSPSDPFHPDGGWEGGLLPGLALTAILAESGPDTDRVRFALTTLVRERNRLHEALDLAAARFEAIRSGR